ncbi:MAG: heavy-metal-associated domain-containing protein [candidate division WOR-3 bacterium]
MKKVVLKVNGMTCMGCVSTVRKVLEKKGGKEVKVSLEEGKAEFLLENGNLEEILKSLEIVGYPAEVISEN